MALEREIGVNLWTVLGWEPQEFVLADSVFMRVAAAGASAVELALDERAWTFERVAEAQGELRAALDRAGLAVSGVALRHFFDHNPASQSADVRGRALRAVRSACRLAHELGAATIVVVPGMQERLVPYEATFDAAMQTLAQTARYAEDAGVTIAVENVPLSFLQSPREFRELIDAVASPAVGACLDLGNVLAAGQEFPENWILELNDLIALVHAKDHLGGREGGMRACGDGSVRWDDCLRALDDVGYKNGFVVETPPNNGEDVDLEAGIAAAEQSIRFLATTLARHLSSERMTLP